MKIQKPVKWKVFLVCFVFFLFHSILINAQDAVPRPKCCQDSICLKQAIRFAAKFKAMSNAPVFKVMPYKGDTIKRQLLEIRKKDRNLYNQFTDNIDAFKAWVDKDIIDRGERGYCFFSKMEMEYDTMTDWVVEATSHFHKVKPWSPEFCRGWRFQIEASTGVKDITAISESFIGSLTGLVSYTFAPRDSNLDVDKIYNPQPCNGRFRILAGLSESYTDRIGLTQGVVRTDIKLFDIKTEYFTVGNVKGFVQGNFGINRPYHSVGVGIGADLEIVGFNIMYAYGFSELHSLLQTSLVYQFKKGK